MPTPRTARCTGGPSLLATRNAARVAKCRPARRRRHHNVALAAAALPLLLAHAAAALAQLARAAPGGGTSTRVVAPRRQARRRAAALAAAALSPLSPHRRRPRRRRAYSGWWGALRRCLHRLESRWNPWLGARPACAAAVALKSVGPRRSPRPTCMPGGWGRRPRAVTRSQVPQDCTRRPRWRAGARISTFYPCAASFTIWPKEQKERKIGYVDAEHAPGGRRVAPNLWPSLGVHVVASPGSHAALVAAPPGRRCTSPRSRGTAHGRRRRGPRPTRAARLDAACSRGPPPRRCGYDG